MSNSASVLAARDRSLLWALLRLVVSAAALPFALVWVGISLLRPVRK